MGEHHLKYHEVGLEFRLIAFATFSTQQKFPRIGLQCPYTNCDPLLFFDSPNDVISHLQLEHNEDLKELIAAKNISTLDEAADFCMDLGKIPKQFDDKLIYCCPFAKNDICLQECHVDNAQGLIDHLESFHALHRDDGQLIINILRFMELKPIWRHWNDKTYTDGMHKRLEALLKYRGNVRKGFVRDYKVAYSRKYKGKKEQWDFREVVWDEWDETMDNVSILNDKDVFWKNSNMDKEIFEQVINKAIAKKHGPKKSNKAKRGRKRNLEYCMESDL